tara:strand:+ start:305 stop:529 length:225 start_codon:yes stop_codon:yes gene_type:complete
MPINIKLHPVNSIKEGNVLRKTSARIIVNGICIEKSKACLLGPNLLRHTNKKVSPIIMPIIDEKKIAVNIDSLK